MEDTTKAKRLTVKSLGKVTLRSKIVSTKLTEHDYKKLQKCAKKSGISVCKTLATIVQMHFTLEKQSKVSKDTKVAL